MEKIPILRMGEFLLVTIQVDMHDRLALALQDDLTTRISETGARGVLIDISSLGIVDSFIGRMLVRFGVWILPRHKALEGEAYVGRHKFEVSDFAGDARLRWFLFQARRAIPELRPAAKRARAYQPDREILCRPFRFPECHARCRSLPEAVPFHWIQAEH